MALTNTVKAASWALALVALCPQQGEAATASQFTGKIVGLVKNASGVAQMGATVVLMNRFEKPLYSAMTDERGAFGFDALGADVYSVRVTLASFMPAFRQNISVAPGVERYLSIQLATLFSSVELFYSPPPGTFLMSEQWRAALRSSMSTRPVLRALPDWDPLAKGQTTKTNARVFSDTRGMFKLSSGDENTSNSLGSQTDLGTAFAVGTSLFGRNQVQVSGNVGYGLANGIPTAGFRTSYQREATSPLGFDVPNPQVSLTMRQLYLPMRAGMAIGSASAGAPALRTLSATVADRYQLGDTVLLEYGATMDSVQFIERLNYLSPYARLTWDGKSIGTVRAAFSSGFPPVDLLMTGSGQDAEMQREVSTLALFPRITRRNGTTQAQRVENFELSYSKRLGTGELFATVYREGVSNAGLSMLGGSAELLGQELVPDLASNASVFNIGGYYRNGFVVGWTQSLGGDWKWSSGYGLGGVLRTDQHDVVLTDKLTTEAASLRDSIRQQQRNFASMKLSGTLPRVGTRLYTSYLWTDYRTLTPYHASLTGQGLAEAGWNLGFKQPVPGFLGMPGRLEINADMRNLLAQGYVPIRSSTGQTMWLIPTPKQVRGGLSFIF